MIARRVNRLLAEAARGVRLLGAATPIDAARERERLVAAFETGGEAAPRWTYASAARRDVREMVAEAERELRAAGSGPLVEAYAARAREIDLEAEIAESVGTDRFAGLARERFATRDPATAEAADDLARAWIAARPAPCVAPGVRSDAPDPRSLLSRMRAAVSARKLPFAVVAHDGLMALAATGERTILVATGRAVTDEDVARTVLHEVEGHAAPRARACAQSIGLFAIGTAQGADDQEGYALVLEERAGFASPARRRQLAARHAAVGAMLEGASFVEATRALIVQHGVDARDAVVACERAFRGGDGIAGGLGRERVYIEAFVRVGAHLATHAADEAVIAAGQVAVDTVGVMRAASVRG